MNFKQYVEQLASSSLSIRKPEEIIISLVVLEKRKGMKNEEQLDNLRDILGFI